MYEFKAFPRLQEMTLNQMQEKAEETFQMAQQIHAGGRDAADQYALAWHEHYMINRYRYASEPVRREILGRTAAGALACAAAIVERGEPWYIHDAGDGKVLVTATLIPDASAGAVGYDPLAKVTMHG